MLDVHIDQVLIKSCHFLIDLSHPVFRPLSFFYFAADPSETGASTGFTGQASADDRRHLFIASRKAVSFWGSDFCGSVLWYLPQTPVKQEQVRVSQGKQD